MRNKVGKLFLLTLSFAFSLKTVIYGQAPSTKNATFKSIAVKSAKGDFNPCVKLLEGGLRDVYTTADHVSFFSDSKHYFASEEFIKDYHDGKWNGGISAVIDGVTLGLFGGSSDQELHEFQKKIQQASSVVVQLETYSTITRSTLNVELANKFNECIEITQKFGLSIDISGDKTAAVTIKYKTLASGDKKPTIASVDLIGIDEKERDNLLKGRLKIGTVLPDQLVFTATRKPSTELVVAINTSNGLSLVKRLESNEDVAMGNLPVGTVVASMLNFEKFSKLTKSNSTSPTGEWSPKSKWAPCDGRLVVGSRYHLEAAPFGDTVPDLRGVFVRGLNQFDRGEPKKVADDHRNPEDKKPGNFQGDAFKSHTHDYTDRQEGEGNQADGGDDVGLSKVQTKTTTAAGNSLDETRPKNVSIYYYIRIN